LRKAVKDIRDGHGAAEAFIVDVTQPNDVEKLATAIFDKFGSVRLLVNNAGIEALGFTWEISSNEWSKLVSVNVLGVANCVRAFVPRMLASGEECWISNVASQAALDNIPGQGAYCVTKHAVQSLTECLYVELSLKTSLIHVSSIIPGMVRTNIFDETKQETGLVTQLSLYREKMASLMALYGQPAEESAVRIIQQIAENNFWVCTHPEGAANAARNRAAYLNEQLHPRLVGDAARALEIWQSCEPNMP
jgi:short-subunit dehydrogenase